MANQIALYYAGYPREEGIAGVKSHIERFWERRMRVQLAAHIADGGSGLHELVLEAAKLLSQPQVA
jgi:formate dehydrogenase subunit delta